MSLKRNRLMLLGCFLLVGVILLNNFSEVNAASGDLDPSFNPGVNRLLTEPDELSFSSSDYSVGEGDGYATITLMRRGDGTSKMIGKVTLTNMTAGSNDYRFKPGSPDTSFRGSVNSNLLTIVPRPDGKIIIGGFFTTYNGTPRNCIARLNPDASLDTSFDPGLGAAGSGNATVVRPIAVQTDGKIIIGGDFTTYNNIPRNRIARLNSDGSLDTSFDPGLGVNGLVRSITLQSDGKIIVGGEFTTINGIGRIGIARLNANGSVDTSFSGSLDFDLPFNVHTAGAAFTTSVQADGRIVIGGHFNDFFEGNNRVIRDGIARLNSDGSLDTSFDTSSGANGIVRTSTVQPDGKIIIGGEFTTFGGLPRYGIARLNSDGSLDTSFDPGASVNSVVFNIALQPDGKVSVATGASAELLNPDGTPDTSFRFSGSDSVFTTAMQADGKILFGGSSLILRLNGDLFVTWEAGDTSDKTISLPIVDDSLVEADETLTLNLTPLLGGATVGLYPSATLTIVDNDIAVTSLSVAPARGTYNGTATLMATLNSSGSPVSGKTITFKLDNNAVGTATTDSAGVATLSSVSLAGINAGTYDGAVEASFAGELTYRSSLNTGTLQIDKVISEVAWNNPADIAYGSPLGDPQLKATANVPGTFIYTPAAGALLRAGNSQSLHVDFTPTDTSNYNTASMDVSINVAKATLTIQAEDKSRPYGDANPQFTYTASGFACGDTAMLITGAPDFSTTATQTSPVSSYAITPSAGTLNTLANYNYRFAGGTLSVNKAQLIVTANDINRLYGDANPAFTVTLSAFKNGETTATSGVIGSAACASAATPASSVSGGPYSITCTQGTLFANNYEFASFVNGNLNLAPAPLTVTAANADRSYGEVNPALSGAITGLKNGDAINASYSTTATAASAVGDFDIVPAVIDSSPTSLANYTVTLVNGTLTIKKAALVAAAAAATRGYGDANPSFTGTITGVRTGDNISATYASGATEASLVGTYGIIPTLVDPESKLDNYNLTSSDGTLTVIRAQLTIRAENQIKTYGDANPALTGVVSGLKNGDAITASYSTTATVASNAGSYQITATAVDSSPSRLSNYEVTLVPSTLTINKAGLLVTVADKSRTYSALNPEFTGTITGLKNSDPITATYGSAAITTSSVGTYPIIATLQDASSKLINYQVTATNGTLTVFRANLTVTWTNPPDIPQGTPLSSTQLNATATFQGASLPGTFIYTPALGTILNAGAQQTLLVSFTPVDITNFNSPATASVQVTVLTIQQAAGNLATGMVTAGLIPQSSATAVTNAMVNAVLAINHSSPATRAQAVTQLRSYVSLIGIQVAKGQLPAAQGQALTATLNSFIALIKP